MKPVSRTRSLFTGIVLTVLVLLADQASKLVVLATMKDRPPLPVTPFFDLVLVWNYGISFGMFAAQSQAILIAMAGAITIILLIWLGKNTCKLTSIALGLVIGGALGNIIDRLAYGAVVDFLDFHIAGYHWPAFNIADSCIFIGVVLLCAVSMFMDSKDSRPEGTMP